MEAENNASKKTIKQGRKRRKGRRREYIKERKAREKMSRRENLNQTEKEQGKDKEMEGCENGVRKEKERKGDQGERKKHS